MSDELDVRLGAPADDLGKDGLARARFEENRRYSRRPAIENLDRPALLVSTRDTGGAKSSKAGLITVGLISALLLLSIGVLIGILLQRPASDDATDSAVPATTTPDTTTPDTTTPDTTTPDTTTPDTTTPTTAAAVQTGVLQDEVAVFDTSRVAFEPGTAQLTPSGQAALDELAGILLLAPSEPVEISVHTFSESTPGLNHGLSVEQADAIRSQLTQAGIGLERLNATGRGSAGSEQPTVAGAIRVESTNAALTQPVENHGPIVLDTQFDETLADPTTQYLATLGALLAEHPEADLALVGYAWSEDNAEANHDVSHHLLDEAMTHLLAGGASPGQISLVGLGDIVIPLASRATEVEVRTGVAAAVGVALGSIELDATEFNPGTAVLSNTGRTTLDTIVETLLLDPAVRVEIAVHTYGQPSSQANHDLSQQQAQAIVEYLTTAGVAPSQLELMGHGDPPHFAAPDRFGAVTYTVIR